VLWRLSTYVKSGFDAISNSHFRNTPLKLQHCVRRTTLTSGTRVGTVCQNNIPTIVFFTRLRAGIALINFQHGWANLNSSRQRRPALCYVYQRRSSKVYLSIRRSRVTVRKEKLRRSQKTASLRPPILSSSRIHSAFWPLSTAVGVGALRLTDVEVLAPTFTMPA
jgi:hypothetical protein